jgi:hypothetical protein
MVSDKPVYILALLLGYWQVPLDLESRRKSAFITPFGHYQFTVMPFGMINSGATFVRMMDKVLEGFDGRMAETLS